MAIYYLTETLIENHTFVEALDRGQELGALDVDARRDADRGGGDLRGAKLGVLRGGLRELGACLGFGAIIGSWEYGRGGLRRSTGFWGLRIKRLEEVS